MSKSFKAFLFTPSLAPILYVFYNYIATSGRTGDIGGAGIIALICYSWAIIIGFPLSKVMRSKSWSKWWQYFIVGFISGSPFAIFWYGFGLPMMLVMFVTAGIISGVSAIVFWAIINPAPNKKINKDT
jgi:hypothetical protein